MLASTAEETWRLNTEIADLLLTAVEKASRVFELRRIPLRLGFLLLCSRHRLLPGLLGFEVLEHRPEVALVEDRDLSAVELRAM